MSMRKPGVPDGNSMDYDEFYAQWCLNVIMALDFIREALPKTLHEADLLVSRMPAGNFRQSVR